MIRNAISALALLAALAAAPASATVTNLLTNGSFENGLVGWTLSGTGAGQPGYQLPIVATYHTNSANYPVVTLSNSASNPNLDPAGSKFLYLNSDAGTQTISQNVSLTAGASYTFGFDYLLPGNGINNANGASLTASIADSPFVTFNALGGSVADVWKLASGTQTFTAAKTGTFAFSFAAQGYAAKDFAVDRVFLARTTQVAAAVPEPATWAMMLAGFAMVGVAVRRRRGKGSVAIA